MSSLQLVTRLISAESQISNEKLKSGKLSEQEWAMLSQRIEPLNDSTILIDDTPALPVFDLRAKCRRFKQQYDIQCVIIDYLQLMSGQIDDKDKGRGNREQEISVISRSLKTLAKELDIPIIALSQLNRGVETRTGSKKPVLADLRESGAIEQDADMVLFIYRPEYYKIDTFADGTPSQNMAEIIIAKHRNGALDDVKLRFIPHLAKFENVSSLDFDDMLGPNHSFDESSNSFIIPSSMNTESDTEVTEF
jgi:replicative DNA helicase